MSQLAAYSAHGQIGLPPTLAITVVSLHGPTATLSCKPTWERSTPAFRCDGSGLFTLNCVCLRQRYYYIASGDISPAVQILQPPVHPKIQRQVDMRHKQTMHMRTALSFYCGRRLLEGQLGNGIQSCDFWFHAQVLPSNTYA